MRKVVILLLLALSMGSSMAQVEIANSNRAWYSLYAFKKVNHRWSIDSYSLLATRSLKHDYWLSQFNLGVNYRLNKHYTISAAYGHSLYKYTGAWWDRHYPSLKPSSINTVSFHSLSGTIKRQNHLGKNFLLANKLTFGYYIPRFEKYQTRIQYTAKVSYRKRNLPLQARPFLQGAVYYYLNGVATTYYEENDGGQLVATDTLAPNGIHRFRLKAGLNFRPFKELKWLSSTIYYGYNREFNGFGNDLNFVRPSSSGKRTFITYPFNTYSILGFQMNVIF